MKTTRFFLVAFFALVCFTSLMAAPALSVVSDPVHPEPPTVVDNSEWLLRSFCDSSAELIGFFAHPTSDYAGHSVRVSGNTAYLTISLEDAFLGGYNDIQLRIWVNSYGFIGGVSVVSDEDYFPAFTAMDILKDALDDVLQDYGHDNDVIQAKSVTSQIVNRTYYNWTGRDICLFFLNTGWLADGYYSRY